MKMACKDCRYCQKATGLCRRFPPSREGFPHVEPDCWCYCFKGQEYIPLPPKENPVLQKKRGETRKQAYKNAMGYCE